MNQTAPSGSVERRGTAGQLNRNESTSHLANKQIGEQREVELKAQSNEHSQLFMESQSHYPSQFPAMARFTNQAEMFQGAQIYDSLGQQIKDTAK